MFGQVLICVLRGSSGIYSSLGVGVGGVALLGGDWGPRPASCLYWHVPFVMKAAEAHLSSPVSQPREQPRGREEGRRQTAQQGSLECNFRSEITPRCSRQGKVYRNIRRKEARLWVHFLLSLPSAHPLNTCHPLENWASGRSLCWRRLFLLHSTVFCFFSFSFYFYFSYLLFPWEQEVRQWSRSSWFLC